MRQGWTIAPAGLVLVAALMGADGGPAPPPGDWVAVTDARFGQSIAPIYLVLRPDVQGDLRLDRRQIDSAGAMVGRLVDRLLGVKNKAGQPAMAEKRAIDEMMAEWLRRELSDAQRERLMQISLQWEGASAMRHPSVREFLGLGEPQRARIERLLDNRDALKAAGRLSPAEFDRASREAMAVLNPIQKRQWDDLLGPPCRFVIGRPAAPAVDPGLKGRPPTPGR